MSDKEESTLMNAVEKYGTLRDKTMVIFMLHTGLRSMEVCDIQIEDIVMRKSGHVIVRSGKRNKQRRSLELDSVFSAYNELQKLVAVA